MTQQITATASNLTFALVVVLLTVFLPARAGEPKELVIESVYLSYDFDTGEGTAQILGQNFPELQKLGVAITGSTDGINITTATETEITITLPTDLLSGEYLLTVYKEKKGPVCKGGTSKYCDEFDLTVSDARQRLLVLEQQVSCGANCCEIAADCDDGLSCTTDACSSGTCANEPVECVAPDMCSVGACDEMMGACSFTEKTCPGGYSCDPNAGCRTFCTNNAQCADGFHCDSNSNACEVKKANGEACTAADQCASGACPSDDGICCDRACDSTCEACLGSKTGQANGLCAFVSQGTDPDNECSGFQMCSGTGQCTF